MQYVANAYRNVELQTAVETASPLGLVLMLYDGSLQAIVNATRKIAEQDAAGKSKNISKAIEIISIGLAASLDTTAGGEIALNLQLLYDHMCRQLLIANVNNDANSLEAVHKMLSGLRDAWQAIDDPAAYSSDAASRSIPRGYAA